MSSYYSIFHHIPFSSRLCSDPISCCDRVLCCCALNKGALVISSTILGVPYSNYSPRNPNHTIKAPLLLALPLPLLPTTSYLCLACVLIGTCDLLPSTRCLLVTADETAATTIISIVLQHGLLSTRPMAYCSSLSAGVVTADVADGWASDV